MILVENLLRKLRFEVESIKTNVAIFDTFLQFRPDLVIMTARGSKINGLELIKKMNPKGDGPKILLAISGQAKIRPSELQGLHIAGFIESPVHPLKALELIANHLNLDKNSLMENLLKTRAIGTPPDAALNFVKSKQKNTESKTWVTGDVPNDSLFKASNLEDDVQTNKYVDHKLLDFELPKQQFLDRSRIQKELVKIRAQGPDPELDHARKEFVRALYRK